MNFRDRFFSSLQTSLLAQGSSETTSDLEPWNIRYEKDLKARLPDVLHQSWGHSPGLFSHPLLSPQWRVWTWQEEDLIAKIRIISSFTFNFSQI